MASTVQNSNLQPGSAAIAETKWGDGAVALLATAEELFGEFGIEATSTRKIILAAGKMNNSAVTYHFGDRAGLLRAIFEWRSPELEATAQALYRAAEADRLLDDPATLIGILLLPFVEVRDGNGKHTHAAFMYQTMRSPEARSIRFSIHSVFAATSLALQRLEAVFAHFPPKMLNFRLRLAAVLFFEGLIEHDRDATNPELPRLPQAALLRELLQACAVLVMAPLIVDQAAVTE